MSAKSSIQVCIKVRPCEPELPNLWQVKDKRTIHLIDSPSDPCVFGEQPLIAATVTKKALKMAVKIIFIRLCLRSGIQQSGSFRWHGQTYC